MLDKILAFLNLARSRSVIVGLMVILIGLHVPGVSDAAQAVADWTSRVFADGSIDKSEALQGIRDALLALVLIFIRYAKSRGGATPLPS